MTQKYDYRIGFKTNVKDKWYYSFWKCNYALGVFPSILRDFIIKLQENMDSDILIMKIERRDSKG